MFSLGRRIDRIKMFIENEIHLSEIRRDSEFPDKRLKLYRTAIGDYYLPTDAPGDVIVNHMKKGKMFGPEVVDVAKEYIKEGGLVLDIGANFGQMSIEFSKKVGESGQVLSFEADDFVFHVLQENIKANHRDNIRAFCSAVYDRSHKVKYLPTQDYKRFPAYGSYGLDPKAEGGRAVITLAIDDLFIRDQISFMKIDVQGSDLFALRGAVETIKKHRMPILFEYEEQFQAEFNTSFQDYLDFINLISYRVARTIYSINYLIVPDTRKMIPVSSNRLQDESPSDRGRIASSEQLSSRGDIKLRERKLCMFLKSRQEVDGCTDFLRRNGYVSHGLACKDWDLSHIIPEIGDGNFLDMGSSDSYILKNISFKRVRGELYGIDLRPPDAPVRGVKYIVGDLMNTPLPDNSIANITCLSVIEHEVDFERFASEASRLLERSGRLFVTFDYWNPKIMASIMMYGLKWQPLDETALKLFIAACRQECLYLVEEMDWTLGEAVIRDGYYSPHPDVSYTFGLVVFEKGQRPM